MVFNETDLPGAWIIEATPFHDERGTFARVWCRDEFEAHGLRFQPVQANVSRNRTRGTVRGMHYQESPHRETKIVRCSQGAIWDVIVDLRPESPTFCRWAGFELSGRDLRMVVVPEGCAHGYITLGEDTEVAYQTSCAYSPGSERGVRFDDPAFAIAWPVPVTRISSKDASWPDFAAPPQEAAQSS